MKLFYKKGQARRPKFIKPVQRFDEYGKLKEPLSRQIALLIKQIISNVWKLINAGVLLVIIVSLSLLVGIYAFPISQLNAVTLQAILNIITKNPFPQTHLLFSTLFACMVALYIYLPKELPSSKEIHDTSRRLTRFVAGFILVALFDSWFFGIDFLFLSQVGEEVVFIFSEPLIAQGVAFVVTLITLRLFRGSISFGRINVEDFSPLLIGLWNWGRFLLISFGLVLFSGWFSTWFLLSYLGNYLIVRSPVIFWGIEEISLPLMTAIAVSATIAAVIFAPPEHRRIAKRLITWRLLFIIVSVGSILWVYPFFNPPDPFFLITTTAFGVSSVLVIVQRALS